jgi:peptide/nickel transport system ATP-binding protein
MVVLQGGCVVEEGPADQVVGHPQAAYTKELLASMPCTAEDGCRGGRPPQACRC